MTYIIKKPYWWIIWKFRNRAVRVTEIREYLEKRREKKDIKQVIDYLVRKGLAVRVVEDIYFIKDPFTTYLADDLILGRILNKAGVNWYFGLFSAYANGRMSQEGFSGEMIVNDKYSGKRKLGSKKYGVNVYFIKTKRKEMFKFGIESVSVGIEDLNGRLIETEKVWISDPEKTVLDFIYFNSYGTVPSLFTMEVVLAYFDPDNPFMTARGRNYRRMKKYLEYYPKFVRNELYGIIRDWGIYDYDKKIREVFEL